MYECSTPHRKEYEPLDEHWRAMRYDDSCLFRLVDHAGVPLSYLVACPR